MTDVDTVNFLRPANKIVAKGWVQFALNSNQLNLRLTTLDRYYTGSVNTAFLLKKIISVENYWPAYVSSEVTGDR